VRPLLGSGTAAALSVLPLEPGDNLSRWFIGTIPRRKHREKKPKFRFRMERDRNSGVTMSKLLA
jgi:hypothetical protein